MRIGINGSGQAGQADLARLRDHARAAAERGFASWWLAQTGLVDALTTFASLGPEAGPPELGTAVVPTWPRHPSMLAAQALTAHAATGGRVTLGIGLSHAPVVEGVWGMNFERPIRHMDEYLTILTDLMSEGSANLDGEVFTQRSMGASPRPAESPPSVMLAALGPQMLDLCGRRADGTLLWMVGPRTIAEHIAPRLGEAASSADRSQPRIVCSLPVAVTDDPAASRSFVAEALAVYGELPSYRAMLDREGADGPADVSLLGDEDHVRSRLEEIAEAGATDFSAAEIAGNTEDRQRTRALLASLT